MNFFGLWLRGFWFFEFGRALFRIRGFGIRDASGPVFARVFGMSSFLGLPLPTHEVAICLRKSLGLVAIVDDPAVVR